MTTRRWVGLVFLCALAIALLLPIGPLAPVVVGGLLVLINVGLALWGVRTARPRTHAGGHDLFVASLTVSWLAVSLLPAHNFASASSTSATSSVGLQPLLELVVFGAAGVVALAVIRSLEPTLDRARPPGLLFLLSIWVMVSSAWSASGPYAFVRGAQMLVICLLAWATVAVGRAHPPSVEVIAGAYLRWFLRVTLVLVGLGFAFGTVFVPVARSNEDRFSWIGAHPNGSGLVLVAAIVIAVAAPATLLRVRPWVQGGIIGALFVALYFNHSRAAWLALAVGLLVVFTLRGFVTRLVHWVGAPLIGAGLVAAVYFYGAEIWDYLLRDRGSDNLATGNGRRELWGIGMDALDNVLSWLGGLGYGATRSVFLEDAEWAGEAHNSVLSLLVNVGLVGIALFLAAVAYTVYALWRGRTWAHPVYGTALAGLLVLSLVNGLATDILAEPAIGFAIVNLIAAVALGSAPVPKPSRSVPGQTRVAESSAWLSSSGRSPSSGRTAAASSS